LNKVVVQAKTVELAVASALEQLNTTEDKVVVRILEQPRKGFLGLFGFRDAKVEVEKVIDPIQEAIAFIQKVTSMLGFQIEVEVKDEGGRKKPVVLGLKGENLGPLIGKQGTRIASLQLLTELYANRKIEKYRDKRRFILDADNYRERREGVLTSLAKRTAQKVLRTKTEIALDPMPAMDRKVIHQTLQSMEAVTTRSEGEEPFRYVVIRYHSS
jgi:spoIIIJ-associated protein